MLGSTELLPNPGLRESTGGGSGLAGKRGPGLPGPLVHCDAEGSDLHRGGAFASRARTERLASCSSRSCIGRAAIVAAVVVRTLALPGQCGRRRAVKPTFLFLVLAEAKACLALA